QAELPAVRDLPHRARYGAADPARHRGDRRLVLAVGGAVSPSTQVAFEGLRDRVAGRFGGVPGIARAFELVDVLGHLFVFCRSCVDRRLPRRGLGAEAVTRRVDAGELLEAI